jgi:hypothetical protein
MEIGWIGARERGRSWIWRALPRHIVMWPIDGQKKGNPDVFNDPLDHTSIRYFQLLKPIVSHI